MPSPRKAKLSVVVSRPVVERPTEWAAFRRLEKRGERAVLTEFESRCLRAERRYLRRFRGSSDDSTLSRMKWVAAKVGVRQWWLVQAALKRCDQVAEVRLVYGLEGWFDGKGAQKR